MLTPAKDDKNFKKEAERAKAEPHTFGFAAAHQKDVVLQQSGGLTAIKDETQEVAAAEAAEAAEAGLKAWAQETAQLNVTEITAMMPEMVAEHIMALIAAEEAGKNRKSLLDELNTALTNLKGE